MFPTPMYISPLNILRHFLFLFSLLSAASSNNLSDAQIDIIKRQLQQSATHSWELGTRAQALLELSAPSFSVLTPSVPLPPPSSLDAATNSSLADVLTIARNAVAALPSPPANGVGQPLFIGDASAADPTSVGIAVLIANRTGLGGEDYASAATAQVEYLLGPAVPKTSDGAISHLVSSLQLWSDFVYMVPPFFAYYGITTSNQSMLQEAYAQIRLYRDSLSDSSGLWQHISSDSGGADPGHWSTGNAWAAGGMLRVLGTLKSSSYSEIFEDQIQDLGNWVAEIHGGMYPHLQSNGLFKNYADSSSSSNFDDASGSALLAATVYRLALLTGNDGFVPQAERTRTALFAGSSAASSSSNAFANTPHFTSDGWLRPVTNPLNIGIPGTRSPEGEAFVLMLHAAWRDWLAAGSPGAANTAPQAAGRAPRLHVSVLVVSGWIVACTLGDLLI